MYQKTAKPTQTTYYAREAEEKERGHSFFPNTIFKDILVAAILLIAIIGIATFFGTPLELEANPAGSAATPRPEWYFLFLFQALKYLPGQLEWVGAIVVPTIVLVALFFLPLYDKSPWRHPLNRPVATGLATFVICGIAVLTYLAATAPEVPAAGAPSPGLQLTPLEQAGKRVYDSNRCAVCHRINGVGGSIGPDLSVVGRHLDASWLVAHLENPSEIVPGTRMPQISLTNDELMSLTAYLLSLKEPETRTPVQLGSAIFAVYCNSCHPSGRAGAGPALVGVPQDKVVQTVRSGGKGMPAFGPNELTDEQLTQVIAYLKSIH